MIEGRANFCSLTLSQEDRGARILLMLARRQSYEQERIKIFDLSILVHLTFNFAL